MSTMTSEPIFETVKQEVGFDPDALVFRTHAGFMAEHEYDEFLRRVDSILIEPIDQIAPKKPAKKSAAKKQRGGLKPA